MCSLLAGGPAGLSAALSLGRLRRSVLVVDDGRPRNQPSSHVNNLPGHDGIHPVAWRARVWEDLGRYKTVRKKSARVATISRGQSGFRAVTASGSEIFARKVVLAYGMLDALPAIPGLKQSWGVSVLHCPFCHGYEVRDQRLGMVGNLGMFAHLAPIIAGLSSDLLLFTNGRVPTEEQRAELAGFRIVEDRIESVKQRNGQIERLHLSSGESIERHALFYAAELPLTMKTNLGEQLKCARNEAGHYEVDAQGKTSTPGVFAAGDIVAFSSVLQSSASGSLAGASLCFELAHEDHLNKVAESR